jgi:hypothetical protein
MAKKTSTTKKVITARNAITLIAHRGNTDGPSDAENHPEYIDGAIEKGYDVEIDVRCVDGRLWLGHDVPQYPTTFEWLNKRSNKLWIHTKDQESLMLLGLAAKNLGNWRYFWHSTDAFTLTSNGMIWCHDTNVSLNARCIIPLLDCERVHAFSLEREWPGGICSDYVDELRTRIDKYAKTQ